MEETNEVNFWLARLILGPFGCPALAVLIGLIIAYRSLFHVSVDS